MRTFDHYSELLRAIRLTLAYRSPPRIGIDGFMSSGKTALATVLAMIYPCPSFLWIPSSAFATGHCLTPADYAAAASAQPFSNIGSVPLSSRVFV